MDQKRAHPKGPTGTWEQAEGGREDTNRRMTLSQKQACGAGSRDERQRLEGGGRSTGGYCTTTGEEVGSGCYREIKLIWIQMLLGGGR